MWRKLNVVASRVLNAFAPVVQTVNADQSVGEGEIKNLQQAANGLTTIMKKIVGPVFTIIGVLAVIYAIYLGVMYAKAESADKRKEVQGRLIGACVGAVIIIAAATLCFAINWAAIYHNFSVSGHQFVDANGDGVCDSCSTTSGGGASGGGSGKYNTTTDMLNAIKMLIHR